MKIELNRLNEAYHLEAINEDNVKIEMDSSLEHGGSNLGFRPMQMLLAGIGGCSAIDVIDILKKQRQELKDIKITVDGEREKDKVPALWETIHLHYRLFGDLDAHKVKQAIELSLGKYCSVAKTLEKTTKITYTFEVLNV